MASKKEALNIQVKDIQETQDCAGGDEIPLEATAKNGSRVVVAFSKDQMMLIDDFLQDNELIHNKKLIYYKDPINTEAF